VAYASCSIVLLSVLKKKKFTSIRARKFRGLENLIRVLVLMSGFPVVCKLPGGRYGRHVVMAVAVPSVSDTVN